MAAKSGNGKSGKSKSRKAKPTSAKRSTNAFAYSDRIPMISDVLKTDFDGSATVVQLFAKLRTKSGEFDKERRVAATLRYDKRENGDASVFVRNGKQIEFRKRTRSKIKSGQRKPRGSKRARK